MVSEPNLPGPDELQRRLQAFLQTAFQQPASPASEPAGGPESVAGDTDDVFNFHLTPREIKEHLDRYVIKQDEAKKVLSIHEPK